MATLNVDPQRVDDLMRRFHQLNSDMLLKENQMNQHVNQIKDSWNDSHYMAFKQQFDDYHKMIVKAAELADTVLIPNLKNIKRFAEDYKNLKR